MVKCGFCEKTEEGYYDALPYNWAPITVGMRDAMSPRLIACHRCFSRAFELLRRELSEERLREDLKTIAEVAQAWKAQEVKRGS